MTHEDVEVVRGLRTADEGEDLVAGIRELAQYAGPDFERDAVLAWWAQDPGLQHLHPDIEWDMRAMGLTRLRGASDLSRWWADFWGAFESYVLHGVEYRDLGDWVLVPYHGWARGREGIAVEISFVALYQVREGKIAVYGAFPSEQQALEAAGVGG